MKSNRDALDIAGSCELLAEFTNTWRARRVSVYRHEDEHRVYTVGIPLLGDGDYIVTEEEMSLYEYEINKARSHRNSLN